MKKPLPTYALIIWIAIVLLAVALSIPNYVGVRRISPMNACINNLRQIDSAKQQWALENHKTNEIGRAHV